MLRLFYKKVFFKSRFARLVFSSSHLCFSWKLPIGTFTCFEWKLLLEAKKWQKTMRTRGNLIIVRKSDDFFFHYTDKKGKSGVNFFGFSISFAECILISSRTGVTSSKGANTRIPLSCRFKNSSCKKYLVWFSLVISGWEHRCCQEP